MGKDLRGKEIGDGIYQQPNGTYCARFVDKFGIALYNMLEFAKENESIR